MARCRFWIADSTDWKTNLFSAGILMFAHLKITMTLFNIIKTLKNNFKKYQCFLGLSRTKFGKNGFRSWTLFMVFFSKISFFWIAGRFLLPYVKDYFLKKVSILDFLLGFYDSYFIFFFMISSFLSYTLNFIEFSPCRIRLEIDLSLSIRQRW